MFKHLTAVVFGAALLTSLSASAEEYKLPEETPVVSFSFPEKWEASEFDGGVEATSEDGEVYIAIEGVDAQGVEKSMDEAFKYLTEKGVKPNPETVKTAEGKLEGMDVVDISLEGTDEDGACKVTIMVIAASDAHGIMVIYWASPEGEKTNQADLDKIVKSIKKL